MIMNATRGGYSSISGALVGGSHPSLSGGWKPGAAKMLHHKTPAVLENPGGKVAPHHSNIWAPATPRRDRRTADRLLQPLGGQLH